MIARIIARVRSLWRGLRHRADVEAEMREEFLQHIRDGISVTDLMLADVAILVVVSVIIARTR